MTNLAVVMSVCLSDNPAQFRDAVSSILLQTLSPDEILIVIDGPVPEELDHEVEKIAANSVIHIIRLPENLGLGGARHIGVKAAQSEIIAVMDSDDISIPERFALQKPYLDRNESDVVGGYIEEFDLRLGDAGRIRRVPTSHQAIFRFGRWRTPINHVTIMFRREVYLRAGGYHTIRMVEDWDLCHRLLMSGARFMTVAKVLVHVRCGSAMLFRRRGIMYMRKEIALFWRMLRSGYLSPLQFAGNVAIRIMARLMPNVLLRQLYRNALREHGGLFENTQDTAAKHGK